jgi:dTDP-glucose 4,6-dehydratase
MNNILVTGGAGFIGSNFIKLVLNSRKYNIINYDKLTYAGNIENLKGLYDFPNYNFELGDICDSKHVEEIINKYEIDTIVNFAAESHVDRSILSAAPFLETNVNGTVVLLQVANKYKIQRFLQVSTDEVYGSANVDETFDENSNLAPNSPYSASKASADLFVRAFNKTFGTPTIITRSSNNYGPYQYPEKLIPLVITKALNNEKIPVYGDGLNVRDWIYVDDNCQAILTVLENGNEGEIYNISANNEKTNLDIIRQILHFIDKSEDLISFVKDRPGHDRRYSISSKKLTEKLQWKPNTDFDTGIRKTIVWYRTHLKWLEDIQKKQNYIDYYNKQYLIK